MFSSIFRILHTFERREIRALLIVSIILFVSSIARITFAIQNSSEFVPIRGGAYREGIIGQPIAINPILSTNYIDHEISALLFEPLSKLVANKELSADGRVLTLKLYENLSWSDGEPLTSDDALFTITLAQNMEAKSQFAKRWQGVSANRISSLQFTLTFPTPYVFYEDSILSTPIIPEHIYGSIPAQNFTLSTYMLKPVGSGPYKFKSLSTRSDGFLTSYRLTPNNFYHGTNPYIEDFYFQFYENEETLLNDFNHRRVDGYGTLFSMPSPLRNAIVESVPMERSYSLFFNQIHAPSLKDKNFRYILSSAINRDRIIEEALYGNGSKIFGPLPHYPTSTSLFNDDEARELFLKMKDEPPLTLTVPSTPFLVNTANLIKEMWASIGYTNTSVLVLPPEEIISSIIPTRDYDILLFGNIAEVSEDLFSFWHSSERFFPGLNLALYQNLEVDALIESIRQTVDKEKRKELIERAFTRIQNDIPAAFLFTIPYTYTHIQALEGVSMKAPLTTPWDRFREVYNWNTARIRVIK